MHSLRTRLLCLLLVVLAAGAAHAQLSTISGTVYDATARRPLEAVAVMTTSGRGTITDSMGNYIIAVSKKDSIWFSLIGKSTMKYPVDTISNASAFNVMIHVFVNDLPEVKVRNRYYRFDSLQNRKDYAKAFNFRKPGIRMSTNNNYNPGGVSVGFDLTELINMFRFKRNRQMAALQNRLIQQEQEAYIKHRFTRGFVSKVLGIQGATVDSVMEHCRPPYEFLTQLNDLEFGYYIQQCYEIYRTDKNSLKYKDNLIPREARREEVDE